MQYSNHTDNLNRAIAFEVNQKDVTRFGGLAPLMNRARRSKVPAALARVIDKYTPRDHFNFVYDTEDLINQVLASLAAGMPDFNDVERSQRADAFPLLRSVRREVQTRSDDGACRGQGGALQAHKD